MRPPHLHSQEAAYAEAARRLDALPARLAATLLPFQRAGVAHILRRRCRCLLADEPGVGKTLQAIACYAAYCTEGPLCVVVPASLRLHWAEELERHVVGLRPEDITLIFASSDKHRLDDLPRRNGAAARAAPCGRMRAVVISYAMLGALRPEMLGVAWGMVICDESHAMRTTMSKQDSDQTEAASALVRATMRAVLLTGTPSLNRPFDIYRQVDALYPGLLGACKWDFADAYCECQHHANGGRSASGGCRLGELHMLLTSTGLLQRRTKADLASELPPKRRTVVRLTLGPMPSSAGAAKGARRRRSKLKDGECEQAHEPPADAETVDGGDGEGEQPRNMTGSHVTGLRKLGPTCEWLLSTLLRPHETDIPKVVIFAHHKTVMNGIQQALERAALSPRAKHGGGGGGAKAWYVRIDGETDAPGRAAAVSAFAKDPHVRCALLSVRAAGTGLDFSTAGAVVFAELPLDASDVLQAEARVHRRGMACHCVNVYFVCARGTDDETRWTDIAARLARVATLHDGGAESQPPDGGGMQEPVTERYVLDVDTVVDARDAVLVENADVQNADGGHAAEGSPPALDAVPMEVIKSPAAVEADRDDRETGAREEVPAEAQPHGADGGLVEEDDSVPRSQLRFQVSAHTGRLHIYTAHKTQRGEEENGKEDGAQENAAESTRHAGSIHRSDLEAVHLGASPEALPWPLNVSAVCRAAARAFLNAFDALEPGLRQDLLKAGGHPARRSTLRTAAVAAAAELAARASTAPVVPRATSVRRTANLEDLAPKPPEGSQSRYVALCPPLAPHTAHVRTQWVSPAGMWLCVACNTVQARVQHFGGAAVPDGITASDITVAALLDLCCGPVCLEWMQLRINPAALRAAVFARDRGVCSKCHLDCGALHTRIKPLTEADRRRVIVIAAPAFAEERHAGILAAACATGHAGRLWQADHQLAVIDGGGLCGLDNMRTLCVVCHLDETSRLASRRAAERREAANASAAAASADTSRRVPAARLVTRDDDDDFVMEQPPAKRVKKGKRRRDDEAQ